MFTQKTIHGAPLLPDAQTCELVKRWQERGESKARDRICASYYRLAVGVASSFPSARGRYFEDAVQEGMLGLLRAIDRFDPTRGVKFSTYAPIWVRAYVVAYLRDRTTTVRIAQNRHSRKVFSNLGKLMATMYAQGEEVTSETIAQKLSVPVEAVERTWSMIGSHSMKSLDDPKCRVRTDRIVSNTPEEDLIEREAESEAKVRVRELEGDLPTREREILLRRLLAEEPATLQQLGDEFGVSKERIRQLERRIKKRLRESVLDAA